MLIKLPRLNVGWDVQPGLFTRYWNQAMSSIEDNFNSIVSAQGTATGAQTAADAAQVDATAALADSAIALAAANAKVVKSLGPSYSAPSGVSSRSSYASYSAPTVSNPPTQAEVQAIANALQTLSQQVVAIITDLRSNEALTP